MTATKSNLYRANRPQMHNGFPFQKVNKINEKNGVVTFTTEWPVRTLNVESEYWLKNFTKTR